MIFKTKRNPKCSMSPFFNPCFIEEKITFNMDDLCWYGWRAFHRRRHSLPSPYCQLYVVLASDIKRTARLSWRLHDGSRPQIHCIKCFGKTTDKRTESGWTKFWTDGNIWFIICIISIQYNTWPIKGPIDVERVVCVDGKVNWGRGEFGDWWLER